MLRDIPRALVIGLFVLHPILASADTGITGGGQAFSNRQASLALNYFVPVELGIFPARDGPGALQQTLGSVRIFAGNFDPGSSMLAQGQLLPIAQHTALFSLLGTEYGGDGKTTFALPDLRGRAPAHAGSGPWLIGEQAGIDSVTLAPEQMPVHSHTDPSPGGTTGVAGAGHPFSNVQLSLGLNYVIATEGIYPTPSSGTAGLTFLGQVALFAGNFAPAGWAFADGQTLAITENDSLFSLIGTTFGGDGEITFNLPDLRGRTPVGTGAAPGLRPWLLGQVEGAADITLNMAQLPTHAHDLAAPHGTTGTTGGGAPFDNLQPSMGLGYLIAVQGLFPAHEGGVSGEVYLGELTLFAGNFEPRGWMFADGRLLPINQNQALFSLLGTTYGGDGRVTFALPDLRGRAALGAGLNLFDLGEKSGTDFLALTEAELSAHLHASAVPLPAAAWLLLGALLTLNSATRRRANQTVHDVKHAF